MTSEYVNCCCTTDMKILNKHLLCSEYKNVFIVLFIVNCSFKCVCECQQGEVTERRNCAGRQRDWDEGIEMYLQATCEIRVCVCLCVYDTQVYVEYGEERAVWLKVCVYLTVEDILRCGLLVFHVPDQSHSIRLMWSVLIVVVRGDQQLWILDKHLHVKTHAHTTVLTAATSGQEPPTENWLTCTVNNSYLHDV